MNPLRLVNPVKKIEAYLCSNDMLKDSAQRAFLSYIKAIALMKDKRVFNVEALDSDSFAHSIGLVKPPRIRFLQRRNSRMGSINTVNNIPSYKKSVNSEVGTKFLDKNLPTKRQSETAWFEDTQDDGDEFLEVKREDHNVVLPKDMNLMYLKISKKDTISKPKSQAVLVNKMLKHTGMQNKKIIFTDLCDPLIAEHNHMLTNTILPTTKNIVSGYNETTIREYNRKKSNIALQYENENVGGIDLKKAKDVLQEEDIYDKQLFKEKVKAKHKEEKRKLKEEKNKNKKDGDIDEQCSEDDGESPDLSWLPDPDKIYCKSGQIDVDKFSNSQHSEDTKANLISSRSSKGSNNKQKRRHNADVETKNKRKKNANENLSKNLSIHEAEELALLLLKDQA